MPGGYIVDSSKLILKYIESLHNFEMEDCHHLTSRLVLNLQELKLYVDTKLTEKYL
jgi:hypothetical protein